MNNRQMTLYVGWLLLIIALYFALFSYGLFSLIAIIPLVIFWKERKGKKQSNVLVILGQYLSLATMLYATMVIFIGLS